LNASEGKMTEEHGMVQSSINHEPELAVAVIGGLVEKAHHGATPPYGD
jgi:hypothetical protein